MKKTVLFFLVAFNVLPVISRAQTGTTFNPRLAHYKWPTDATHYLTSTFGETRDGHFHAALDIKTWGRRGYKVFATRDGIIHRIAIGPRGYGKVIYLKHPDGSFSVYAHLLAFRDSLQQFADSIRFAQNYKFEIDTVLDHKNWKVKQGEVIGYSGASGIGPPHLHFELRTPSDRPFNPLLTNLKVKDTIPPKFLGISVEPKSPRASIEGENAIYTKRAWKKNRHYELGSVTASGPIGLGVDVYDKSNRVHNVYAVYKLRMTVDGQELFKARVDSFSYKETEQMYLDRVYPILEKTDDGYQRLYRADGNTLSFYKDRDRNAVLNLSPGDHKVMIRAEDYFGNASTASLLLHIKKEHVNHSLPNGDKYSNPASVDPYNWSWFHNWVTLNTKEFSAITLGSTISQDFYRHRNEIAVSLKRLDNLFMNIPGIGPITFQRKKPVNTNIVSSADWKDYAVFPQHAFYDTVSIGMAVNKFRSDSIQVDILPEAYPLRKDYKFYVRRDSNLTNLSNLSFYKWDREHEEWDLVPTRFSGHYMIGKAESLGHFTSLRDTVAPKLKNPRLSRRPDGQWLVMIDARDTLSGINDHRTKISVNGIRGIAEYEPEDDRFVYYKPDFQPSSSMNITVTAYDKIGNKRVRHFHLGKGTEQAKR